jgi:two-component system, LytTR family, response regulator LytT
MKKGAINVADVAVGPFAANALLAQEKKAQISFAIRLAEKRYFVSVANIAFVYLDDFKVYLIDFEGNKHLIAKTLESLEAAMPAQQFYRINRQTIVNRQAIADVEGYANQRLVVHLTVPTPEKIIVPRLKVRHFLSWAEKG